MIAGLVSSLKGACCMLTTEVILSTAAAAAAGLPLSSVEGLLEQSMSEDGGGIKRSDVAADLWVKDEVKEGGVTCEW